MDWRGWLWQNGMALLSALLPAITVALGAIFRAWRRHQENLLKCEDRKQQRIDSIIIELKSGHIETQTMAAVALKTCLETERGWLAVHAFHLAVASLRLIPTGPSAGQDTQVLRQELIEVVRKAFPLARALIHDPFELDATSLHLEGAYFAGADLKQIAMHQAILTGADLCAADLSQADLSRADLRRARLAGTNCSQTHLEGAWLEHADLRGAQLKRAGLGEAKLAHANLIGANLREADLQGADLRQCIFQDQGAAATLYRARLAGADLRGVDLRGVDVRGADLRGANLQGADFSRAIQDGPATSFSTAHPMALLKRYLRELAIPLTKRATNKR